MLGENQGIDGRKFQLVKVVTICDNLQLFILVQLKHEICWKTIHIPADCLVQQSRRYAIEFGEVCINNDLFTTDQQYPLLNLSEIVTTFL